MVPGQLGDLVRPHPQGAGDAVRQHDRIAVLGAEDLGVQPHAVDRSHIDEPSGGKPVGGETTPMTYVSPESGRQFLVITVGGNRATPIRGDYIMAFALPE